MRHRLVWEVVNGAIPKGYEIDHLCKNRRCCRVEHLDLKLVKDHRAKDNSERYLSEYLAFKDYYLSTDAKPSQVVMGKMFNRTQSGISIWVKRLKQEIH